ncbi:MAG TPA: toxin-antitoxin system HicB family antitoxin [Solirubrobacteraceae bacterium]|jgi:hypothetical protein|nr:toxin-antitoxin system HicB family antitoxin [Solirubrobacteraceae bacterium]
MASARAKPARTPSDNESGHSGRLLLRMDPALHAGLAQAAEHDGQSLNAYITGVLSDELGGDRKVADPADRVAGRLIRAAVIADLVLVAVAAAIAIVLLVVAWP